MAYTTTIAAKAAPTGKPGGSSALGRTPVQTHQVCHATVQVRRHLIPAETPAPAAFLLVGHIHAHLPRCRDRESPVAAPALPYCPYYLSSIFTFYLLLYGIFMVTSSFAHITFILTSQAMFRLLSCES